jgi:tRNA(His) 5'-end guanylyltransferase
LGSYFFPFCSEVPKVQLHDCRELKTLGEYERFMKRFEVIADGATLPDVFLIIRADAHRHTGEWNGKTDEGYPFNRSFVESLGHTAEEVLRSTGNFALAFMHGDEISFLLNPKDSRSERRRVRLCSHIASAAGAAFALHHGKTALFHCVLSELPTTDHVVSYFLWQRLVAERNYMSWLLAQNFEKELAGDPELKKNLAQQSLVQRIAFLEDRRIAVPAVPTYERSGALFSYMENREVIKRPSVESLEAYLGQLLGLVGIMSSKETIRAVPSSLGIKPGPSTEQSKPTGPTGPFRVNSQRRKMLPGNTRHKA